jgi:prefoldin subunit 5
MAGYSASPLDGTAAGALVESQLFKKNDDQKRGIPEAIFIENVEALCAGHEPTHIVGKLQDLHSKYQYMQSSLTAQRASLKQKLPDISAAFETVNHLVDRKEKAQEDEATEYTYQLADCVWSKASAPPSNSVCLWLGANCMLEYTLDEAVELLRTNEANAKVTLKSLEEDMAFLRDQITTTEVNIARTHNFGVKQRQLAKEGGEEAKPKPVPAVASSPAQPSSGAYTWKQEAEEVEVSVPTPSGAQKSEVKVTILADSIKVEHLGKVLLQGSLAGKVSPNGSTWTMTGSRVEITLEKAEQTQWASLFDSSD